MLFEEKLIYFPTGDHEVTPRVLGLDYEQLTLVASDGRRLDAWHLPAPERRSAPVTVLVCHGNAGNISHRLDRAVRLQAELGADVLLFDYRGFGRSEGRPYEEGTYLDALAAHRHLLEERAVDPRRLVLLGESLGAAVAVELSIRAAVEARAPAAGLVLEAPFTSIAAMARVAYPFLPLARWVRTRYDNLAKIGNVGLPLLIVHGRRDPTVPFSQGQELYRAAVEPKRFLAVEQAAHNDAYLVGGKPYWDALRTFLADLDIPP